MFDAKIIADSVNELGSRLTTVQLRYPRFIHAELMTHRVFSRNASSSRAIPVKKLVKDTLDDPAFFVHIGRNQKGMQAGDQVPAEIREQFRFEWNELAHIVAGYCLRWAAPESEGGYNIHKQIANRPMEAWHHISVVVTSSRWRNFFALRDHPKAMPEIRVLAEVIRDAMHSHVPEHLQEGDWHLPYASRVDADAPIRSSARCARTSYNNHDGKPSTAEEDKQLFATLVANEDDPAHGSPLEHPAQAMRIATPQQRRNFSEGWAQFRALWEIENNRRSDWED